MIRLDLYLSTLGYVKSRQRAKTLIEDGCVSVNSQKITKPSYLIDDTAQHDIIIKDPCPYVSRGGLKLEKVINELNLNLENAVAIDIGASTGGFTDCLLKHGTMRVYAVDSGSEQLDSALKCDDRVISIENYNARNISVEDIGEHCDIITVDVSFISQTYIMPRATELLKESGAYISLIKPQFEVGRDKIGKGGIVKNPKDRLFAIKKIIECAKENNLFCRYLTKSPILGGDGNAEFLALFTKGERSFIPEDEIKRIAFE